MPDFAAELNPSIVQLHSSSTAARGSCRMAPPSWSAPATPRPRSPSRFRGHPTSLSGRSVGQLPVKHGTNAARFVLPLVRFAGTHVLTLASPIGRKAMPRFLANGAPLVRTKRKDLAAAGVELLPRTTQVRNGFPALEDGRVLEVANVIWCTGFAPGLGWIDLDIFDDDGRPVHRRGVVPERPACSSWACSSSTRRRRTFCPASGATPITLPTRSLPAS